MTMIFVILWPLSAEATNNYLFRLSGDNRVETSVAVSQQVYKNQQVDNVVLAGWHGEVDALTGTLLASSKNAPLLLINTYDETIQSELKRLGAKNIYLLGGEQLISEQVVQSLTDDGYQVQRIAGDDRWTTATAVADESIVEANHVFLANDGRSGSLADALAAGPASGKNREPILLTSHNKVPQETLDTLKRLKTETITIIGGPNVISQGVENTLHELGYRVQRLAGDNRWETAEKIAEEYFADSINHIIVNDGRIGNFADAVVGGYLGANENAPVLLTLSNQLNSSTESFLHKDQVKAYILGGETVVTDHVKEQSLNHIFQIKNANAARPINVETPEPHASLSGQTVHPDVLYVEDGWNGHSYWMAHTPYHNTNEKLENPSLSYSDDGINFTTLPGASNPIDAPYLGLVENNAHMSDADLLLKPDETMEIYYRYRDRASGAGETIFRKTSIDAVNWTEREVIMRGYDDQGDNILSPALIYENDHYRMWWVDKGQIYTSQSQTGLVDTWSAPEKVSLKFAGEQLVPWHLDVVKEESTYYLILNSNPNDYSRRTLAIGQSQDGVNFEDIYTIMRPTQESWDNYDIYRASMVKVNEVYKLYYSAMSHDRKWHVGLTESNNLKFWNGVN